MRRLELGTATGAGDGDFDRHAASAAASAANRLIRDTSHSAARSCAKFESSAAAAFTSVLNAAVGSAATALNQRVAGWTDKLDGIASGGGSSDGLAKMADEGLDDLAEGGGATQGAAAMGIKAGLHGKSPFWAAIKGAWEGGKPVV